MRKLHLLVAVVVAAMMILVVFGGVALAATSTDQIILDYQQNGKLTGSYTKAQLQAYLNDATVHQNMNAADAAALDAIVKSLVSSASSRGSFPFTGYWLFAGLGVALVLVGGGLGLRRAAVRR